MSNRDKIGTSNKSHSLTISNQVRMLRSEVGELDEAVLLHDWELIAEELADVVFVCQSISLLAEDRYLPMESLGDAEDIQQAVSDVKVAESDFQLSYEHYGSTHELYLIVKACMSAADCIDVDLGAELAKTCDENLGKDAEKSGGKVTKS